MIVGKGGALNIFVLFRGGLELTYTIDSKNRKRLPSVTGV